jgi:hypothetical protein
LLLFLQKKKILFFSEEKNQKTFISFPCSTAVDYALHFSSVVIMPGPALRKAPTSRSPRLPLRFEAAGLMLTAPPSNSNSTSV